MSDETASLPPPSASIINLAIADLAIYAALFFPAVYITWRHGKAGMVCWPIFLSYFGIRFAQDIYLIVHRVDPLLPNTVAIMTNAGSLACLSLTIIGILYEVNHILPMQQPWTKRIILGVSHITNTTGIALATYGGAPSATGAGGVASRSLNQAGNCLMLFVMFTMCWWILPTWKMAARLGAKHPVSRAAKIMTISAGAALPFQIVRLVYNTTYAFDHLAILDPILGLFAVRLILLFLMQFAVAIAMVAGGLLGTVPRSGQSVEEDMGEPQGLENGITSAHGSNAH